MKLINNYKIEGSISNKLTQKNEEFDRIIRNHELITYEYVIN